MLQVCSPRSAARREANAMNPDTAATPRQPNPGRSTARWNSGADGMDGSTRPESQEPARPACGGGRQLPDAHPRQRKPAGRQQRLAIHRADPDAQIQRDRVVTQRFTRPIRWRKVSQRREPGHEVERLRRTQQQPHRHQPSDSGHQQMTQHQHREQGRTADQQRPPAVTVSPPAHQRAKHQRRHAERSDSDTDRGVARRQRPGDEERGDTDQRAASREIRKSDSVKYTNPAVNSGSRGPRMPADATPAHSLRRTAARHHGHVRH